MSVYFIKDGKPALYLITRRRVSPCGIMIFDTEVFCGFIS